MFAVDGHKRLSGLCTVLPNREGEVDDQHFDRDFRCVVRIRQFRRDVQSKIVAVRYNVVADLDTELTSVPEQGSHENRIERRLQLEGHVLYQAGPAKSYAILDDSQKILVVYLRYRQTTGFSLNDK